MNIYSLRVYGVNPCENAPAKIQQPKEVAILSAAIHNFTNFRCTFHKDHKETRLFHAAFYSLIIVLRFNVSHKSSNFFQFIITLAIKRSSVIHT